MIVKGLNKLLIAGLLPLAMAMSSAQAVVIADNYIGAGDDPLTAFGFGRDVLGGAIYEVYGMEVTFDGPLVSVIINTDFIETHADNYGGFLPGDLFISTDGWSPFGASPYDYDDASNGEDWEYVYDTSEGVVVSLLADSSAVIDIIDDDPDCCRHGQERLVEWADQDDVTGAAVSYSGPLLATSGIGGVYDYSYIFDYSLLGVEAGDTLGFHWVMTCGNDVIEGAALVPGVSVPEPGTMILLAMGVVALGVSRRRH